MAENLSNYAETGILEHIFRNATFAKPVPWVALCGIVPAETDTGATINEIAHGNGYARVVASGNNFWTDPVQENGSGTIYNRQIVQFNQNTVADWGWVSGIAVLDASGDALGNVIFAGSLATAKLITVGDTFSVPTGAFVVRLA